MLQLKSLTLLTNFSREGSGRHEEESHMELRKEVREGGMGMSTVPSSISNTFLMDGRSDGPSRTHHSPTLTTLPSCFDLKRRIAF
ncbi:hypothetical protein NL676_019636 [Syzygium grande]|nr:hypothetical protein NL676_019636 [Syzygium grande]